MHISHAHLCCNHGEITFSICSSVLNLFSSPKNSLEKYCMFISCVFATYNTNDSSVVDNVSNRCPTCVQAYFEN